MSSLQQCEHSPGSQFTKSQCIAGNITVHALQGFVAPAQSKSVANQATDQCKAILAAEQEACSQEHAEHNGQHYPGLGCSAYTLADGDVIVFNYTCDLGADLGADYEK